MHNGNHILRENAMTVYIHWQSECSFVGVKMVGEKGHMNRTQIGKDSVVRGMEKGMKIQICEQALAISVVKNKCKQRQTTKMDENNQRNILEPTKRCLKTSDWPKRKVCLKYKGKSTWTLTSS